MSGIAAVQSLVWIDGEQRPDSGPHVSGRDRGLTLGDGVFETMRVRGGTVFRLERHLARLTHALAALEIPAPGELREWITRAAKGADGEASIRLTVTRGPGPSGVAPPVPPRPTVIVSAGPMPSFPSSLYTVGLAAHVASGRRNEYAMTAGLKTLAYVDAVAGLLEARRAGADEALFLDTQGHCSEATASNIFAWTCNELITPPQSCGVLPGITREAVLELARAEGLPVAERAFGLDELTAAAEIFLTSSLRGLAPVVRLNGQAIGRAIPGPRSQHLSAAYLALVDRECAAARDR
jgi:branched-chain amino acid aminotransferase